MVTKDEAGRFDTFYHVRIRLRDGSALRGRANGALRTWKTRPDHFERPIKIGYNNYGVVAHWNATDWFVVDPAKLPDSVLIDRPAMRVVLAEKEEPWTLTPVRKRQVGMSRWLTPAGRAIYDVLLAKVQMVPAITVEKTRVKFGVNQPPNWSMSDFLMLADWMEDQGLQRPIILKSKGNSTMFVLSFRG